LLSYDIKTLRVDAHSREWNMLHSATALGARISQAKFFLVAVQYRSHARISQAKSFLL
jgi:hypothetical protein